MTKKFGGVTALTEASMTAEPGTVVGLIGANGSGKTTLLNTISGFYSVTDGSIHLGGVQIDGQAPHKTARNGVARTFQTPLIPESLTTREVVATARPGKGDGGVIGAILRLPRYRRRRRENLEFADRILSLLGIEHLAGREASGLSLGSRRLVEVARAAGAGSALLLLDEPASGLDEHEVDELAMVIGRLKARGATVVVVEHNFNFVCAVSDQLCVLELGQVIATGTPEEVRADPDVVRSYLGSTAAVDTIDQGARRPSSDGEGEGAPENAGVSVGDKG